MPAAIKRSVLCFGEILWDFLPEGLFPGGAPFNVAYHLHCHGIAALPVSAVGRDLLGEELLRRIQAWEISSDGISRHAGVPTGYVRATIGKAGDAGYEIITDVAWDRIDLTDETRLAATTAHAVVFGSLAQRSSKNHQTLAHLLSLLPAAALRIFDVNLRPPFDDLALVTTLAAQAQVLKLNAGEAARLTGGRDLAGQEETHARKLAAAHACELVIITAGARGAGLLRGEKWHWEKGRDVHVADTIGAGDAFLASLVSGLLNQRMSDSEVLARACRLGEWVASHHGATPAYDRTAPL